MSSAVKQVTARPSLRDRVITQAIAIVFFVIVPIVITLMVPLTNIEFRNSETGATVTVHRYVLIFIPWKTQQITNVTRVRADITAEKHYRGTSEERRKGQSGVRVATGQVAIIGDGPEVIVQAAPDLAKEISRQFDEFVVIRSPEPMTFAVYASWPLSWILGGVVTALCALYVVGATLAVLTFPFKLMRSGMKDA
jgi:ABC-type sugar transport system permease subunit